VESGRSSSGASSGSSSAIGRLLEARERHGDTWGTLDAETLVGFQEIFEEIGGRGKSILEIGSGNGFTSVLFGLLGASEVHGLEVVPSAVATAEQVRDDVDRTLTVHFRQGDAAQPLPYPGAAFDALLLVEVISHVVAPSVTDLLAEMVRVVKPGGVLYVQDGNNARSWKRRRDNYEIWRRFERGPITEGGETVHSHRIGKPYVETRRDIALSEDATLSPADAWAIAERTFRYDEGEVRRAVRRFRETRELPDSVHAPKLCPIEPVTRSYIEELVDPVALVADLKRMGCEIVSWRTRRRLPLDALWRRFPRVTMAVANGFTVVARKRAVRAR